MWKPMNCRLRIADCGFWIRRFTARRLFALAVRLIHVAVALVREVPA
jgi:hypothetical protein